MPPNVALAAQLLSIFLDCTYHALKCRFKDAGADGGLQVAVGCTDTCVRMCWKSGKTGMRVRTNMSDILS